MEFFRNFGRRLLPPDQGPEWLPWRYLHLAAVLAFWLAYILTRPLGASIGDFLSQPTNTGGLGLGTAVTSAIFLSTILAVVAYLATTKQDQLAIPVPTDP